jgi:hypothetical protein
MKINVFEGCRRIALIAALLVSAVWMFLIATNEPYLSYSYEITYPGGKAKRSGDFCSLDSGIHFFTTATRTDKRVSITLCLLPMSFGADERQLIPYKVDDAGTVFGAARSSEEVSSYANRLEGAFRLDEADEVFIDEEYWRRYRDELLQGLLGLAIALVFFAVAVWLMGWIVRGFLGIPRGQDRRPE